MGANFRRRRLAGVLGFEPRNGGIKIRCLTTWLYPNEAVGIARQMAVRSRRRGTIRGATEQGNGAARPALPRVAAALMQAWKRFGKTTEFGAAMATLPSAARTRQQMADLSSPAW